MLTLPSMLVLLACGMMFVLPARSAHAEDVVNQPRVADEASTASHPASSQTILERSQWQEETQPAEEDTSNVSFKGNSQQEVASSDSSTKLQDPAKQTPPEITSEDSASGSVPASSAIEQTGSNQEAAQNQSTSNQGPGVIRATSAQVTATRSVIASQAGDAILDLSADKASYRPGEDVNLSVDFKNTTDQEQDITVYADVYYVDNKLGTYKFTRHLKAGEGYKMQAGDLKIPASQFENNRGYLVKIKVADVNNNTLGESNRAIAVESDWTKFPRYGIVGGSQDTNNSLLSKDADRYRAALEKLKNMNINSYFFYDVYKTATNPFPSDEERFKQDWNTWSGSEIETQAVKDIVNQVHEGGAVAMLYNMILAENTNTGEAPALPETEYAYNSDDRGYGAKGQPMSYTVKIPKDGKEEDVQIQRYYNPTSKQWQNYIADKMGQAMKNGGFDGWQGDTIGDNEVYSYADKDSNDPSKKHWLTEGYAEFLRAIKEKLPNYYLTVNDVNGEQIYRLKDGNQDVIYNEIWPFGGSALKDGRNQTEYGDLKARVDEVRKVTGKSLIVGAYMEGSEKGGSKRDAEAGKALQTDAVLLTSASIAAAGGYHMSLAALANQQNEIDGGQGIGVLQTAYYPTQSLKTSSELTRKNNDYQQFITAYENILRDGVENDDVQVNTYNSEGKLLSTDAKGINGHQVWTYGKKGNNFRTVQLLNLMGINSDWKNEDGSEANKTPDEQTNLTVKYALGDVSMEDAQRMANQTYVTSPDDWSKSNMQKVSASVETDENGKPVLVINVPKLTLWDVVYISAEDEKSAPDSEQEQSAAPADKATDDKAAQGQVNQPATPVEQPQVPAQAKPEGTNPVASPTAPENSAQPEATEQPATQDKPEEEASQPLAEAVEPQPEAGNQAEKTVTPAGNFSVEPAATETPATPAEGLGVDKPQEPSVQAQDPSLTEAPTQSEQPQERESNLADPAADKAAAPEAAKPDSAQSADPAPAEPAATEPDQPAVNPAPATPAQPASPESEMSSPNSGQDNNNQTADLVPEPSAPAVPNNQGSQLDGNQPLQVQGQDNPAGQVDNPEDSATLPADPGDQANGGSGQASQSGDPAADQNSAELPKNPLVPGEVGQPTTPQLPNLETSTPTSMDNESSSAGQSSAKSSEQLPNTGDKTSGLIFGMSLVFLTLTGLLAKREKN